MAAAHDLDAVAAVVEREADAGARAGRLTDVAADALRDAGLFKVFLPADLGGLGLGLSAGCAVIAEVAAADGAAGWASMIASGAGWFAGRMDPDLAAEVFAAPDAVVAGSGMPGVAVPADTAGSWRVDGTWRWCSGAPWATWFTFAVATDDGDGFAVAIPTAEVDVDPASWDAYGLRATASWTARLAAATVPAARVFRLDGPTPVRPEPAFRVPFMSFAEATMAAVAVGVTRRALADLTALARTKVPSTRAQVLADDRAVHDRVARATATARSAAAYFSATVAAVDAAAAAGSGPGPAAVELQLASCHAVAVGADVAQAVRALCGMTVVDQASPLARALADLEAVPQNAVVGAARYTDAGGALLGA
jgi:indole-3-acetate monooxygenase